ncbi:hypothetical protein [Streptomyces sp. NBC_01187]|uniref:hypothetical protein n=1 Tax=Streptomyces sp. NBC_01187 TaxID=2903766 RepID=UPI00387024B2|nr:hypothetical protein OG220_00695 [Streptomyces sp. NBC_01187]
MLLVVSTAGCSGSDEQPDGDLGSSTAGTRGDARGGHFVYYAVDRVHRDLGSEQLDLLDWRTGSSGELSGTWTAVGLSKDPGSARPRTQQTHRISGSQDGNTIEFTISGSSSSGPEHGKISGDTLTLDGDLAAQTDTFKKTDKKAFEKIVAADLASLPSAPSEP